MSKLVVLAFVILGAVAIYNDVQREESLIKQLFK